MTTNTPPIPAQEPVLPMQFGVPLDQSSPLFFACLLAAIGLVYLFGRQKFDERSFTGNDDYVYQFLPRQLATGEEYSRGFLIYFGTMAGIVLLLSLIGPKNLNALNIPLPKEVSYVVVPLAIAFLLVGVLPTVPGLQQIEKWLRKYAHEQAYIPAAARATAERLAAADFDFTAYAQALQNAEIRGVEAADFNRPRRSLEHDWARLSCLIYELKSRRMAGLLNRLDGDLLRDYAKDLDNIEDQKKSMEAEVAVYRAERAKNPSYANEILRRGIASNLYKLYILLGCAVRLKKQPHEDIDLPLSEFGFKLNHAAPKSTNTDLKVVGLSVAAGSVLLLGFAAAGLGHLRLWTMSPVFPQTFFQPFIDTASALIPYIAAVIVADLVRQRGMKKGRWFGTVGSARRAIDANYVRVAFLSGIAGYAALVMWVLVLQEITLDSLKMEAPNALLAMVTGGFYVYHLDNVEMGTRPSRPWEVGLQAFLTGICGLVAACATWEVILHDNGSLPIDRIVLQTMMSLTIGLLFAWYIPQAAAAIKYDPLGEMREERRRMLKLEALHRFGEPAAAAAWCEAKNPALGSRSPLEAAADLDGFEHAVGLLQGPRAVAA
ncbi:MAG TPA: hypothetical protein VF601_16540 [Beijerinckiaceae bacterium]|jgi:hypothetical protein